MGKDQTKIEQIRAALSPHGIFFARRRAFRWRRAGNRAGQGAHGRAARQYRRLALAAVLGMAERQRNRGRPLRQMVRRDHPARRGGTGGTAWFPSEKPWQPFQQWAMRAEGLKASPLGVLIHPDYGLWHGYRGAIGFAARMEFSATTRKAASLRSLSRQALPDDLSGACDSPGSFRCRGVPNLSCGRGRPQLHAGGLYRPQCLSSGNGVSLSG